MPQENRVGQQPAVLAQRPRQRLSRHMGRQALGQPQGHGRRRHGAEQSQADENRLPAVQVHQQPAKHWRENRRQAHDQHQLRKHLGRPHRIAFVADHRPGNHHSGTSAQGLDETRADQPFEARRVGASQDASVNRPTRPAVESVARSDPPPARRPTARWTARGNKRPGSIGCVFSSVPKAVAMAGKAGR